MTSLRQPALGTVLNRSDRGKMLKLQRLVNRIDADIL